MLDKERLIHLEINRLCELASVYKSKPDEYNACALLEINENLRGTALKKATNEAFDKAESHIRELQAALYSTESDSALYQELEEVITQLFYAKSRLCRSATVGPKGDNSLANPLQRSHIMRLINAESIDDLPIYCCVFTGLYPYPDINFSDKLETYLFYKLAQKVELSLKNLPQMNPHNSLEELLHPLVAQFYQAHPYFIIYLNNKLVPPQMRLEEITRVLTEDKVPFFCLVEAASEEHMKSENELAEPLLQKSRELYSLNISSQGYDGLYASLPGIPVDLLWKEESVREIYNSLKPSQFLNNYLKLDFKELNLLDQHYVERLGSRMGMTTLPEISAYWDALSVAERQLKLVGLRKEPSEREIESIRALLNSCPQSFFAQAPSRVVPPEFSEQQKPLFI